MRAELLLCVSLLFSICALPQDRSAPVRPTTEAADKEPIAIEGRVLNALTGEPVRKANLTLTLSGAGTIGAAPPQSTAAVSDAEGKFRFDKLEPGRYVLSAEKPGFVRQQYGARAGQLAPGTTLAVASGDKVKSLEFKLTPQAVISGKVVDEEGEPLSGVMIQVLRQTVYSSRPMGEVHPPRRDRRGMFGQVAQMQDPDGQGPEDYVPTFYPGTTDGNAAVPIVVGAGQESSGIAVRLLKGRVYRVRGKILGATVDRSSRVQVTLQPQRRNGGILMFGGSGSGNVKPDGTFELSSVQPGSYTLAVMRFDNGRPQTVGQSPLTVGERNVDGVIVNAGVPIEITGKVTVEGEEKNTIAGSVFLQPLEASGFGMSPSRIQADGTFKIEGASRDRNYVSISGLPEGMYLKGAKAGESDVLENGLDLSQAESAPPLDIVVSSKGATIEGVVRNEDTPWPGASVTLVPEPIRPDRLRRLQKVAASDQNGRFTLKGIAPGEYRIYAWEEFMPMYDLEPEQLKPYEGYSVKVKVGEEAREQVDLKLARPQQQ